jgi:flavin reductase (DIM6/NTAB) family NADH-FMN oxidoreductase RutF
MHDPRELRRTLGSFATGVVVITSRHGDGVHGMTANSFLSVSMDPPLVLVSIGNHTRMSGVLTDADHYGLSILSGPQEPISSHFATRGGQLEPEFEWWQGVPLIANALGHLVCRISDRPVVGDHTLFIGEVLQHRRREGPPLLFYGGNYQKLAALETH